jgi:hypothetical protein
LDAEPFIERHLAVFERLNLDWEWRIAEGAADNTHDTAWCRPQSPRFSRDGTTEYLTKISRHPKVKLFRRQLWDGKTAMCNACIADIKEPCILLQMDSDEIWNAWLLDRLVRKLEEMPEAMRAHFYCRYFLGKNIISTSTNGYGNRIGEWLRVFRFEPGMMFSCHEPPILAGNKGPAITRDETRDLGLVFDHPAYMLEKQVAYKEAFYGYKGAVEQWKRLQANTEWPVRDLRRFLPWVGVGASADLFSNVYPGEVNPFENL